MKKLISIAMAAVVTLGIGGAFVMKNNLPSSAKAIAFTCEVQGCSQTTAHEHTICSIDDCTKAVNHEHDGILYDAHFENDGHNHNQISNLVCWHVDN